MLSVLERITEAIVADKIVCKLKQLMEDKGLNQSQLAEMTKLAPGTIGKLYRSQFERIDCDTAIVLCNFFKVDLCGLFEIETEED
jgi:putative transcriptional regulator